MGLFFIGAPCTRRPVWKQSGAILKGKDKGEVNNKGKYRLSKRKQKKVTRSERN